MVPLQESQYNWLEALPEGTRQGTQTLFDRIPVQDNQKNYLMGARQAKGPPKPQIAWGDEQFWKVIQQHHGH